MNNLCLCVGIIVLVLVILYLHNLNMNKVENFDDGSVDIVSLTNSPSPVRQPSGGSGSGNNNSNVDPDKYVRRTDVEMAAREAALTYCPVPPDYDPSQYIKKTEMKNTVRCPPMPDLTDYVLKSSIPPVQKCPPCVCPKVKVEAGLCKKCPPPLNTCPKPEPCPTQPVKVCPAIKLPVNKPECPAPQACPKPQPCPAVTRCPKQNCPKCKFYGIKKVYEKDPGNDDNAVEQQMEEEEHYNSSRINPANVSELLAEQAVEEEEQYAPVVEANFARNTENNRCEVPANMNSNKIIGSIFN